MPNPLQLTKQACLPSLAKAMVLGYNDAMNLWENYKAKTRVLKIKPIILQESSVKKNDAMEKKSTAPAVPPRPIAKPIPPIARIKRSKKTLPIDGRLDLHGMTADQGFALLDDFFYNMRVGKRRHLLVITGKGSGVMKQTLQQFLAQRSAIISSYRSADRRHGGDGAYYILLKKSSVI